MITHAQMYWLTVLNGIVGLWVAFAAVSAVVLVVALAYLADNNDHCPRAKALACAAFTWLILSLTGVALTPTTRQMAAIVVIPKVVNSEKVQTAGNKLYELAVEWMEALRPKRPGGAQ